MSDSAIKNYLYGKVIPSVDVLHHMVRVFGLDSIEDILVFELKVEGEKYVRN